MLVYACRTRYAREVNSSGCAYAQPLRQQVAVGGDEVVAQRPDLLDGQRGRRVRVDQGRLAHHPRVAGHRRLDGQLADADEAPVDRRALGRQVADLLRVYAEAVDHAGDLDRVALRKVVDQPVVGHVGVDLPPRARLHAVDDLRRVFGRHAVQVERLTTQHRRPRGLVLLHVAGADPQVV